MAGIGPEMAIPDVAVQLILNAEGLNQPGKWPGGDSGITIGIGYDLGYVTVDWFHSDWGERLLPPVVDRLTDVVGMRRLRARNRAASLADITIERQVAEDVFKIRTLPQCESDTMQAFPGCDLLPEAVRGALVSLVYNRGTSMVDPPGEDRRREMRAIRDAVARQDLAEIAVQLRSMKRLWIGKGLDGLVRRREQEALLVESAISAPQ